ncbi:MAG: T9SS type A sorting domain-containing protein [Flavobacteriales bacterium]|nr:T9SS type A sorting domain-containing protein [Flavobacteriales bacterium]
MHKILYLFIVFIGLAYFNEFQSQILVVNQPNISTLNYSTNDIEKVTLNPIFINIYLIDSTIVSYNLESLNLNFQSENASVDNIISKVNRMDLVIFPNPIQNELKFTFENSFIKEYDFKIIDSKGIVYNEMKNCVAKLGLNTNSVNLENLSKGTYYLSFEEKNFKITKLFIKQ